MKKVACVLLAIGLLPFETVQADTIGDVHSAKSLGFSQSAPYYREFGSSEIVLRVPRDHSSAWVLSGNGVVRNSSKDDLPSSASVDESVGVGAFFGQRRYFGQSSKTRLFGQAMFGGIAESQKSTYTRFARPDEYESRESSTYQRSVALGLGARASFGGEYLFHPSAGIEISTNIEYSRLMWNFADSVRIRRAAYFTSSQVGINWYW